MRPAAEALQRAVREAVQEAMELQDREERASAITDVVRAVSLLDEPLRTALEVRDTDIVAMYDPAFMTIAGLAKAVGVSPTRVQQLVQWRKHKDRAYEEYLEERRQLRRVKGGRDG